MSKSPNIAWKRLAIEAPVIVISILLAFAIDAWWQERDERQAEVVLLERLRTDYTEIQSALQVVREEHQEAVEACIYFLNVAKGDALPATPEVDRMVALVFMASRTFNPGSGALESFHSNEGAQLLQDQQLVDRLLAWSGLVEELQEEEANLQKGVAERWTPFIASRVNVGPFVLAAGDLMLGIPEHLTEPGQREPLVVDDEFINYVLDRYKWQRIALRDIEPVRAAAEEILVLLDKELDGR